MHATFSRAGALGRPGDRYLSLHRLVQCGGRPAGRAPLVADAGPQHRDVLAASGPRRARAASGRRGHVRHRRIVTSRPNALADSLRWRTLMVARGWARADGPRARRRLVPHAGRGSRPSAVSRALAVLLGGAHGTHQVDETEWRRQHPHHGRAVAQCLGGVRREGCGDHHADLRQRA